MTKKNLITFDEIKNGDVIEVIRTFTKGTEITAKGTVASAGNYRVYSTDSAELVLSTLEPGETRTIELLFRPKLPFKTGTLVNAVLKSGEKVTLVRVEQTSDDDQMVWLELAGTGDNFLTEDDIETWTLMKLVEDA